MNSKILSRFIYSTLLLSFSTQLLAENCNRDQAFNKMMAISRVSQERMNATSGAPHSELLKSAELAKEVAMVGAIMGQNKYTEACGFYNEIAEKYGIDLNESAKGMKTMADLKQDGGKSKNGKCSQTEASKKSMKITNKLQDLIAMGEDYADIQKEFFGEMAANADLIYTNPSAYCDKLDSFVKTNSLVIEDY